MGTSIKYPINSPGTSRIIAGIRSLGISYRSAKLYKCFSLVINVVYNNVLGNASGSAWRSSPGTGFATMSQSNRTVEQMFGRVSNFTPGYEGSRGSSSLNNQSIFSNRTSNKNPSSGFQVTIPRVLSVYILPVPTASGIVVSVPTSVSKMRKLMDHHGCHINLQDEAGAYPAWADVDARLRVILSRRKEEVDCLGEEGIALGTLFEGPFFVAHHSQIASEKGKILVPTANDPAFPSVNLSYLTVTDFGFRIPGNEKSNEYCVVLLHKGWGNTYSSGIDGARKHMDTMWDICKNLPRTQVGTQLLCPANCLHFVIPGPHETIIMKEAKRQKIGDSDEDVVENDALVGIAVKASVVDYSVYSVPIPAEVPEAFDHVSTLNDAKEVRQSLFVCLTVSGTSSEDSEEGELSAKTYKRDIIAKYGPIQWHGDHVPSLTVDLGEITQGELAKALSTQLSKPECTFPHALAQSVVIVDSSSAAVDSGGLFAFAANNFTMDMFNLKFGKREIPAFLGAVKVRLTLCKCTCVH